MSTSSDSASTPQGADEQSLVIAKGTVTTAEYQAAFEAFRQCDASATARIISVDVDPLTGAISYALSADELELVGSALHDCYAKHFDRIERVWQLTDPVFLESKVAEDARFFDENLRPCLESNGVEVPTPAPIPRTPEYEELSLTYLDLSESGDCDELLDGS